MSITAWATGDPTCTLDELRALCKASNFALESGSLNEETFLQLANSFDAVCETINDLAVYEDPRLQPIAVEGGERKYYRPDDQENPLNAWSHRTLLRSADPQAAKGPLAGKTVSIKDNVSVAGLPLVIGCSAEIFADKKHPVSTVDATIVRRILNAGGTITGTSTCENFSLAPLSFTSDSGNVHNAWLPDHATGGSSSGSASLLSVEDVKAARRAGRDHSGHPLGDGVDLAIGGDQGGSIRLPASYAGVYGLKPTYGLVPYTGIASLHPMIDHTGPMARSIDDVALLLGVLAGYDGVDPRMTPETPMPSHVPDYLGDLEGWVSAKESAGEWTDDAAARGLRVGVLKESFEVPGVDPAVVSTLRTAVRRFRDLGADVIEDVSVPLHSQAAALWTVVTRARLTHSLANRPSDMLSYPLPGLDLLPVDQAFSDILLRRNPAVVNTILGAARLESKYGPALSRKAQMHVFELRAEYDRVLKDVDVLIVPATPTTAPRFPASSVRTQDNPGGWSETVMDLFEPGIGVTQNSCPFNISGHPAMSIPVGWIEVEGGGRLPIGMQIVAKRWDEASILKAAKAWEVRGHGLDS